MHQLRQKISSLIISSILITLVFVNLPLNAISSDTSTTRQGEEYIVDIWSEAVDENNDTAYDSLLLGVIIEIPISDAYQVYAAMTPSNIAVDDFVKETFEAGEHEVLLSLDGSKIYESGRDGPYTIALSVYKGIGETLVEYKHETSYYSFESFNPSPISESDGIVTVVNNTIKLQTNIFVAVIYEQTPMIVFYYTSDDGQTARFKVQYENIICYDDQNNDEKFQNDELKYWGDLLNSQWNSPKILMEDFNNFEFQIQTVVDLMDINRNIIDNTRIELIFHYSSLIKSEDIESIESARKFDITMTILGQPMNDITHIALEHRLIDELGNHDFLPGEDKISFMTDDDKEHGYYGWKDYIEISTSTGDASNKEVTYNLEATTKNTEKMLYLNYPYSIDTRIMFHDPVVGVNPDNLPFVPVEGAPEIISHQQWLFIYLFVTIIVAAIMIGNIYRQKKKREYD